MNEHQPANDSQMGGASNDGSSGPKAMPPTSAANINTDHTMADVRPQIMTDSNGIAGA